MPNWCCTSVVIYANEKEAFPQLLELYEKLHRAIQPPGRIPNSFGEKWLGNIVDAFGYKPGSDILCRGEITIEPECPTEDKLFIRYDAEEAWAPDHVELWENVLSSQYPDLMMTYCAEECGSGIYINTDKSGRFFPDRYRLDISEFSIDDEIVYDDPYFSSSVSLFKYATNLFRKPIKSFDDLYDAIFIAERNNQGSISFHQFEYA